jgi:hypothetical protein
MHHQALALGLTAECFSLEQNRFFFRCITQIGEAGHSIGYESVLSEVGKHTGGEKLSAALEDLTNPLHVPRNDIEWHVEQLKNVG